MRNKYQTLLLLIRRLQRNSGPGVIAFIIFALISLLLAACSGGHADSVPTAQTVTGLRLRSISNSVQASKPTSTTIVLPVPSNQNINALIGTIPAVQFILNGNPSPIFYSFPGTFNSNYTATITIPTNMLSPGDSLALYFEDPTAPQPPGPRTLVGGVWRPGLAVQPNEKTIVFVHGVASSVEGSFGDRTASGNANNCANNQHPPL
jgi:hypothetical protein